MKFICEVQQGPLKLSECVELNVWDKIAFFEGKRILD